MHSIHTPTKVDPTWEPRGERSVIRFQERGYGDGSIEDADYHMVDETELARRFRGS